MKSTIRICIMTCLTTMTILSGFSQVSINKPLQFIPGTSADGELKDVYDLQIINGVINLDGSTYISNKGGTTGTIKLGATGNTTSHGNYNIFIGTEAGKGLSATNDDENVMIGYQSGKSVLNNFSNSNVYIGSQTGMNNINGTNHTFIGYQSGYNNTTGDYNSFLGYKSGYGTTTGVHNSYFGMNAGSGNSTGTYNLSLGYNSGTFVTNGIYNVFVGINADANMSGINEATAIGYNAKVGQSNAVVFGSSTDPIQVGINTTTPRADLDVNTTGAIIIPVGSTMQRPATPVKGMIRFNETTNHLEGYNGTAWINLD